MDGLVVFEASLHFAHVKRFWEKTDMLVESIVFTRDEAARASQLE